MFFLTKTVEIRWNWRCKIFSLKIWRCKILDKFHVCFSPDWQTGQVRNTRKAGGNVSLSDHTSFSVDEGESQSPWKILWLYSFPLFRRNETQAFIGSILYTQDGLRASKGQDRAKPIKIILTDSDEQKYLLQKNRNYVANNQFRIITIWRIKGRHHCRS